MRHVLRRHESYVFAVLVAFSLIVAAVNPGFLTLENLFDLLKSYAMLGILAVGVLVVLIAGGIDISFTAVATVAVYTTMILITRYGGNILIAFGLSSLIGLTLGLVNAVIIYTFRIPSIITTIATLNIYYGLLTVVSGGKWISILPAWFRDFAAIRVFTLTNAGGAPYGLSIMSLIWLAVVVLVWGVLRYTLVGRGIYALGGSPTSARRAGFNLLALHLFVYGLMGGLAGLAGLIQALLVQTVAPNALVGKELDVLAAVVLGGASLSGGSGTLTGTLLGVALVAVLSNGLTMMRVPSSWYGVCIGLVIIASVSLSAYRRKARVRRPIIVAAE
ncbi:MAG: ABC transporter permease [Chloroflexales bacterium]|nr:ABC transporter permease [Chloroflexales bacterium]